MNKHIWLSASLGLLLTAVSFTGETAIDVASRKQPRAARFSNSSWRPSIWGRLPVGQFGAPRQAVLHHSGDLGGVLVEDDLCPWRMPTALNPELNQLAGL